MPRDAKGRFCKADKSLLTTYKAFDKDMKCRGFQFEVGKTYEHSGAVECCSSGFHSCENPLDVLNYYDLCDSRFAKVTVSGEIKKHKDDTKVASGKITIDAEIKFPEFVKSAVNYLINVCKPTAGHSAKLASSGHSAKLASSGDYAQLASSGDYAQLASSGDYAKLASSGHSAKLASSGDYAQLASSGDYAKLASSGHSAKLASSGDSAKLASSGDSAKLASSGHSAKLASSGDSAKLASSGHSAIIVSAGLYAKAKAGQNGTIVLSRWVLSEKRYRVTVGYVGENIKADTWYTLSDNGEFIEV